MHVGEGERGDEKGSRERAMAEVRAAQPTVHRERRERGRSATTVCSSAYRPSGPARCTPRPAAAARSADIRATRRNRRRRRRRTILRRARTVRGSPIRTRRAPWSPIASRRPTDRAAATRPRLRAARTAAQATRAAATTARAAPTRAPAAESRRACAERTAGPHAPRSRRHATRAADGRGRDQRQRDDGDAERMPANESARIHSVSRNAPAR